MQSSSTDQHGLDLSIVDGTLLVGPKPPTSCRVLAEAQVTRRSCLLLRRLCGPLPSVLRLPLRLLQVPWECDCGFTAGTERAFLRHTAATTGAGTVPATHNATMLPRSAPGTDTAPWLTVRCLR